MLLDICFKMYCICFKMYCNSSFSLDLTQQIQALFLLNLSVQTCDTKSLKVDNFDNSEFHLHCLSFCAFLCLFRNNSLKKNKMNQSVANNNNNNKKKQQKNKKKKKKKKKQ